MNDHFSTACSLRDNAHFEMHISCRPAQRATAMRQAETCLLFLSCLVKEKNAILKNKTKVHFPGSLVACSSLVVVEEEED